MSSLHEVLPPTFPAPPALYTEHPGARRAVPRAGAVQERP